MAPTTIPTNNLASTPAIPSTAPPHVTDLPSLKLGPKVIVYWQKDEKSKKEILGGAPLPKNMLMHFSEVMRHTFSASTASTEEFTVHGLLKESWLEVLKWMLISCSPKGVARVENLSLVNHIHVLEAAAFLKIPLLCKQVQPHIEKHFEKQLHSDRVREIYEFLPPNHPYRRRAVEHICDKIHDKALLGMGHYLQFGEENDEYQADFEACHGQRRNAERQATIKEEQMKVKKEQIEKKKEFQQYRAEQEKAGPGNFRKYADWQRDMQLARGETPEGCVEKHDIVKARVGQNAGGGKKWVHIPLKAAVRGGHFDVDAAMKKQKVSSEDAESKTEAELTEKLNDTTLNSTDEVDSYEDKILTSDVYGHILVAADGEGSSSKDSDSRPTSTDPGPSTRETSAETETKPKDEKKAAAPTHAERKPKAINMKNVVKPAAHIEPNLNVPKVDNSFKGPKKGKGKKGKGKEVDKGKGRDKA